MHMGFVLYDEMTMLDFVGAYDPLTRLKTMGFRDDVTWDLCARTPEVRDGAGLRVPVDRVAEPLRGYDLLYVPGGFGTRELVLDEESVAWMRTAAGCPLKVSVCTGSLLLGAAGFLRGRTATTHPAAFEELRPYCAAVVDRRIVDEGDVITARGVTSAIDLGLYLVEKLAGHEVRERIKRQMDYPYEPALA
jgi:transcriptional regulator GlxA family with amidase domain